MCYSDTTLLIIPDATTTYEVLEIADQCGVSLPTNDTKVEIVVVPVLAVEEPSMKKLVDVYPIPASSLLNIHLTSWQQNGPAFITLVSSLGHILERLESAQGHVVLNITKYPVGSYVLRVQIGDRTISRTVIKQ
jgi:hypothetical protein